MSAQSGYGARSKAAPRLPWSEQWRLGCFTGLASTASSISDFFGSCLKAWEFRCLSIGAFQWFSIAWRIVCHVLDRSSEEQGSTADMAGAMRSEREFSPGIGITEAMARSQCLGPRERFHVIHCCIQIIPSHKVHIRRTRSFCRRQYERFSSNLSARVH